MMPIYPYKCESCNYEFDRLQKISDAPLKICPECGAESLRKKLTAAAFHLKGTGWYETDFKDKKDAKKGEKDADGKDAKKSTDDKKADAKTDDKADAEPEAKADDAKADGDAKDGGEEKKEDGGW